MQKTNLKPVLVPTVYSLRTVLWSLALVALFGALLWAYLTFDALLKAKDRLDDHVATTVEMPLYRVGLPLQWETYCKDGDSLTVFRRADKDMPLICFEAQRDAGYPYHALDLNHAVAMTIVEDEIRDTRIANMPDNLTMSSVGSERLTVKPGVTALRLLFDTNDHDGEAMIFYAGDVRYVLWALWSDADQEAAAEIHQFFRHLFENFEIPEMRESIDRPVVNSADLTADLNAATHLQIEREMALWRLFAARAEAEPDAALLPALRHYREALRLLSSIRQERIALASDDFKLYQHLLEERRKDVAEWFVVLDKAVAMRDWTKACQQAKWIMDHATLTGERIDVRRAADILATKIPSEENAKK